MMLLAHTNTTRVSASPRAAPAPSAATCVQAKQRTLPQPQPRTIARQLVQCRFYTTEYYADTEEQQQQQQDDDDDGPAYELHHVHSRLALQSVALGDQDTYVIAYEDGDTAWSSGLPDGLYTELRKAVKRRKGVAAVALGRNQGSDSYITAADPDEVWFLMRDTGTTYMGAGCEVELSGCWWDGEGDDRVVDVAFAPSCGWYVYCKGGGARWQNLPESLHAQLQAYWRQEGGVEHLSVGHNGEWFVRYDSGAYAWNGVHPTLERLLREQKVGGRDIAVEMVELGPHGTFVALFDCHTVWYGCEDLTKALLSAL